MSSPIGAPQSSDGRRRPVGWLPGSLFLLLLALAVAGFALPLADGGALWGQDAERLIRSWGAAGVAASLALMVAHAFVPFPAEFVAIANGMIFGVLLGTAVTWAGAMLGAALSFGLARRLGQPFVESLVPAASCDRIREWTGSRGTVALLTVRLVPVISFNLVNMVAGVVGVGWWTFLWTTALGILPMTSMMVLVGAGILASEYWPAVGAGVAVLLAGLAWIGRVRSRERRRRTGSSLSERPRPGGRASRSDREPHHADAVHRLVVGTEAAVVLEFGPAENADQASRRNPGRLPPNAHIGMRTAPPARTQEKFREI